MLLDAQLTRAAIVPIAPPLLREGAVGAWAEFTGRVRAEEDGRPIIALEYEAYESMAVKVLRELLESLGRRHAALGAWVIHRLGVIPVGEAAIWVGVATAHRGEAFALLAEFMDALKQDVPIWKRRPVFPATPSAS